MWEWICPDCGHKCFSPTAKEKHKCLVKDVSKVLMYKILEDMIVSTTLSRSSSPGFDDSLKTLRADIDKYLESVGE